ncbi:MAG TPA: hypothetical protein VHW00_00165 [Thermoanaerobaculia bacterium]|nr:hypothetical protein [Thermoanaerobaculia bacterium]
MSTALWIAARDVREKGRLFLIAAVLACMPFLATLLPTAGGNRADVITGFGGILGIAVGLGLAAGLGLSAIGADLSSRRMTYWFSQPITPAALWTGKALAALFTSFACFAIITIPTLLFARTAVVLRYGENWQVPALLIGSMVILFLLGHTASTIFRSRSPILGIDLAAVILASVAMAMLARPILFTPIFLPMLFTMAGLFVLVLAVAPFWQLAKGRTDLRRNHAALSQALWSGFGIVIALAGIVVLWLSSGRPASFDRIIELQQNGNGSAVFVAGSAPYRRGLDATFALNPATGASERVYVPPFWGVAFSRDHRFAAWVEPGLWRWSQSEVIVRDLAKGENRQLGVIAPLGTSLVFADDGTRIAIRNAATLSVYDVADGRVVASMPVVQNASHQFWFVTRDVLRVATQLSRGREEAPIEIAELDLRTKRRRVTGTTAAGARQRFLSVSGDGSRMLLRADTTIVDGRTGALIAKLPEADGNIMTSALLNDGRAVVSRRAQKNSSTLTIYAQDGAAQHALTLPARVAWIIGERTDGKLLLLGVTWPANDLESRGYQVLLVDVNRGKLERTLPDTRGPSSFWASNDPRLMQYDAKAKIASVGKNGKLFYWN